MGHPSLAPPQPAGWERGLAALMFGLLLAGIATLILAVQAGRPAPAPSERPVEGWIGESPAAGAMSAELPAPPEPAEPALTPAAIAPESEPRPAVKEWARVVNTNGRGVILHTEPRRGARTPTGLLEGARVTLVEVAGEEWARVRSAQGRVGWVPTDYLAPTEPPSGS